MPKILHCYYCKEDVMPNELKLVNGEHYKFICPICGMLLSDSHEQLENYLKRSPSIYSADMQYYGRING